MSMRFKRALCLAQTLLLLSSLCGCAVAQPKTKTVILPTQEPALTEPSENVSGDWEVSKMRQYTYSSTNSEQHGYTTTIGWADGDLYTVDGAPGQIITVSRIDPRYGFYETCAILPAVDYNTMRLSPDGRYLLYDVSDAKDERVRLYLYDIESGVCTIIADYPDPAPYLGIETLWSEDGSCFFYWIGSDTSTRAWQREEEKYDGIPEQEYYFSMLFSGTWNELPLTEVMRYDVVQARSRVVLDLIGEMYASPEYLVKFGSLSAFYKKVWVSRDGKRLLAQYYDAAVEERYTLIDCETGEYREREAALFERIGEKSTIYACQVTENFLLGNGVNLTPPFVCQGGARVCYLTTLLDASNSDNILITPDEQHLITIERSSGREGVYVYQFDPDSAIPLSGRKLLYQSTQSIYDVRVTNDQHQIIIRERSAENEYVLAYGDESDIESYPYIITILEF